MGLETFARLSTKDAHAWLEERQREARERRLAECAANGAHTLAAGEAACPHCDTPYSEIDL